MELSLALITGGEIPFPEGGVTFHQPTLKEVGMIGEEAFFIGLDLLKFSKNSLKSEDRKSLEKQHDFNILLMILKDRNAVAQKNSVCAKMLLALLLPEHKISYNQEEISFEKDDEIRYLNKDNFDDFKKLLVEMFTLNKKEEAAAQYNPKGEMAEAIAEKLKAAKEKISQEDKNKSKIDIISRYCSILSVAMQISLNDFKDYTVYQLFDTFKRYELKSSFDTYFQAKVAGATGMEEPEQWMKDIHE